MVTVVQLRSTNLFIGPYIVPLYGRKRMLSLVQFLIQQDGPAQRIKIRKTIYKHDNEQDLSFRLRDSLDCSLSKLISRSRRFLQQALKDTPWGTSIEWFYYHEDQKSWSLCRPLDKQIMIEETVAPSTPENDLRPEDVRVRTINHQVKIIR